ncbi:MAG: hypothetical protein IPJ77_00455 [Planctomycetes bacterium]|nr:hypothetical protein [Planctomycetota bacterium]
MRLDFLHVDRLLRGHFTRPDDLARGEIDVPTRTLALAAALLGASYGAFMGLYGALRPGHASALQVFASAVKVPLLFLLTLLVAFPSLYVLSALADSRLSARDTLRLLLCAIATNLALLASFGPVTAFFTLSTQSYAFMVVLDVFFFATSGLVGLVFLRRALNHVFRGIDAQPAPTAAPLHVTTEPNTPGGTGLPPALAPAPMPTSPSRPRAPKPRARAIFTVWILIYAVVGAQMGWILRPFIGTPEREFTWFRERGSNFFEAFFKALGQLFS